MLRLLFVLLDAQSVYNIVFTGCNILLLEKNKIICYKFRVKGLANGLNPV